MQNINPKSQYAKKNNKKKIKKSKCQRLIISIKLKADNFGYVLKNWVSTEINSNITLQQIPLGTIWHMPSGGNN